MRRRGPHQVVVREIAVHHLHGKERRDVVDPAGFDARDPLHLLAQLRVADVVRQRLDHAAAVPQVPLQHPAPGRGGQTRERCTDLA